MTVRPIIIGSLVGLTLLAGNKQQSNSSQSERGCYFSQLANPDGWDIPDVQKSKPYRQDLPFKNEEGVDARMDIWKPTHLFIYFPELVCSTDHSGQLLYIPWKIGVREIIKYRVEERVFAVQIRGPRFANNKGKRVEMGSFEDVLYYDVDGSGQFRLRCTGTKTPFRLFIPEWVKHLGTHP